ncbi:MAG: hypothetical protein IJU95_03765 [Treponema sp.]|nr:hypothetical protein [Treponema sp.]
MEEKKIDLCICSVAVLAYIAVGVWGFVSISKTRKRLEGEGRELPPADSKFRPAIISSVALLSLPFLIYFKPYITAVLESCAVMGLYITLRERVKGLEGNP